MKTKFSIGAAFLLLVALSLLAWRYESHSAGTRAMPPITLSNLNGVPVALDQTHGKPLVLNLWAVWCPPCRAELPLLNKARASHPAIRFLFAEQGDSQTRTKNLASLFGLPKRDVLLDTQTRLSHFFSVIGYPTTIFYRSNGSILHIYRGQLTPVVLQRFLRQLH